MKKFANLYLALVFVILVVGLGSLLVALGAFPCLVVEFVLLLVHTEYLV